MAALKALMLRKKIDDKKKLLEELRAKDADFTKREEELEAAIDEAGTDEEKAAVEEEVTKFEGEKEAHESAKTDLEKEVTELEGELKETEEKQERANAPAPEDKRAEVRTMEVRDKFFNLSMQERDALFAQDEVKDYIAQVRAVMKRDVGDVNNASLLIPKVLLPYLRQIIEENTKLVKHTNLQRIPGDGRMVIDGGFPEAVWTEMCGKLNELQIGYNDVEIGGYKVGGFIRVCNALLEDSDIALASDIITKLGRGIGYALDKAILYGTGTKMPLGVVVRLAQTAAPSDYPATARPWVDLHTSNIIKIAAANSTGIKLFQGIVQAAGATRNKFNKGAKYWAMNESTLATLQVEAMSINAAGAIVSGMESSMPIVGGAIETLDFIPDNVIIGGYDELYLLSERAGLKTAESEHYLFTDDQTVFKATARYDGLPVIPEGFVAIGINGAAVSPTAVTFAEDKANKETSGD